MEFEKNLLNFFLRFLRKSSVDSVLSSTNGCNNFTIGGLQLKVDRYKKRTPNNVLVNQTIVK
jgi:hypothetical protein